MEEDFHLAIEAALAVVVEALAEAVDDAKENINIQLFTWLIIDS